MKLDSKIKIFDNIITVEEQNKILDVLLSNNFPWFYISDITNPSKNNQKRHALSHRFIKEGELNSNYFRYVEIIIKNVINKLKYKKAIVSEVRSFLQFPLNIKTKKLDTPHIDTDDKHFVFLYYVMDNEANTIIYLDKAFKRYKKIKPKKGRLVIFPGSLWHTAEQPTKKIRCVINCNIINMIADNED
tara:strand:- start:837 stop:1400 length:564 start_codon:yes stop_codon:yes gene_type:complete